MFHQYMHICKHLTQQAQPAQQAQQAQPAQQSQPGSSQALQKHNKQSDKTKLSSKHLYEKNMDS